MTSVYQEHVKKIEHQRRQGFGANSGWTKTIVSAPATTSTYHDHNGGGQYVSASSWQDPPTGPTIWNTVREPPDRTA